MNKFSLILGALLIGAPLVVTFNNYSVHDYIARIQIISPSVAAEHLKRSAAEQVSESPTNVAPDWEVGGVGGSSDHGYALDALAIPYMKDKSAIEIANRGYWCGTPVIRYSMDHEAPSEEFLKARAKILEENIKSGTNFWVATGH